MPANVHQKARRREPAGRTPGTDSLIQQAGREHADDSPNERRHTSILARNGIAGNGEEVRASVGRRVL